MTKKLNKKVDINEIIINKIIEYCGLQAKYYEEIAYSNDYKEETINRIVNLGIAYKDVLKSLELLIVNILAEEDLQKAKFGDPTKVGQTSACATTTKKKKSSQTESDIDN